MEHQDLLSRYSVISTLNDDFHSSLGLAHGKMRAAIFFFHCARSSGSDIYEDVAGRLLDELFGQLSIGMPVSFADGLCGIGWGIEYLIQEGFIEGDADEVLAEIDASVIQEIYVQALDGLGLDTGILGLGHYILMRVRPYWKMGDTDSSLELKENLIYLIDWLDRQLDDAGDERTDELLEWLLQLRATGFYKTKVEKMIAKINKDAYEKCRTNNGDNRASG